MEALNARFFTVVRRGLYLLPIIFVLLAVIQDINPSGVRSFHYTVGNRTAMISPLFPEQRLLAARANSQQILQQPVYFTVRYPHRYDTAAVRIQLEAAGTWQIGLAEQSSQEWQYSLKDPEEHGIVSFDLHTAQVTNGSLRFILATNQDLTQLPVTVHSIDIVLHRKNLIETLRSRL